MCGRNEEEVYSSMKEGSAFSSMYAILCDLVEHLPLFRLTSAMFAPATAPLPMFVIRSSGTSGMRPIVIAFSLLR